MHGMKYSGFVVASVGVLIVAGCSVQPTESPAEFAAVVAEQPRVVGASAVGVTGLNPHIDLTLDVDPSIGDEHLRNLKADTDTLSQKHHWGIPYSVFRVGDEYTVTSSATESEIRFFNTLRRDQRYKGVTDNANFLVKLRQENGDLLAEWERLVALGRSSGGLDDFQYYVYSSEGSVVVAGSQHHPPTAPVAEWRSLAASVTIDEASAWSGVGAEKLDLWVADDARVAAVEALAATQKTVDVHVFLTGTEPDGSCMCGWRWP